MANIDFNAFKEGDTIIVYYRYQGVKKQRAQPFKGVVLYKRKNGESSTFCVRKISYGVGVEKIFPFNCPQIEKVEKVVEGVVRRAKLFYLRKLKGKAARIKRKENY